MPIVQNTVNGTWVNTDTGETVPAPQGSSSSGYNPQSGYGYDLLDRASAQEKMMEELKQKHAKELADLDNSHKQYFDAMDNALKERLSNNQITNEQYQQGRNLAQQESEYARTLAQRQLENQQSNEIARATEMRNERSLQASLAANPQDWVAYEFYKRGLGAPSPGAPAPGQAGSGSPASVGGGASTSGTGSLNAASPTMLDGSSYSPAPPAYADSAAQSLAQSLFSNGGTAYNPNLAGQGVFGTTINNPNSISHSQMDNMSDSEKAMLGSLLKAGVNVGGKQVAIDPTDYFAQQEKSQVPNITSLVSPYTIKNPTVYQ